MSYSFTVRAANKEAAKEKIKGAFDDVVKSQPVHAKDRDAAESAAFAFVNMLEDADKDVTANISGYVSWRADDAAQNLLTSANVSVSASLINRDAP